MESIPSHLQKYIVEQDYQKYTALDHAVWRYIMRQLKYFLGEHAHESYLKGLEQTGIEVEFIPKISDISKHLEKMGWRALPVSGFIPPAAFMELQSLSILPIASDMRSIDHLLYTPAPDIVHEAAGHAPFLADKEYSEYLHQYAQVAKKAIISREDYQLYEAIRELSDIKENPSSTSDQIFAAEEKLNSISSLISFVSEASELSRMNWWTAEYGLIGDVQNPKIYGAGLLSSVGESQWCLSEKVTKIPLTLDCIKQTYDITEPQPQLFVAKSFKHLTAVLKELSETMAFKVGGVSGLEKAVKSESVNTIEFENNLQISGVLKTFFLNENSQPSYLQFSGPTQICYNGVEIKGHDKAYHQHGYGTPVGSIKNFDITVLKVGQTTELVYDSGLKVSGTLIRTLKMGTDAFILSFENAACTYNDEKLFLPDWGTYDIILASKVTSVFGGPSDRGAYGAVDDFAASRVLAPVYSEKQKKIFSNYAQIRELRTSATIKSDGVEKLFADFLETAPQEWLLFLELIEIAIREKHDNGLIVQLEMHLNTLAKKNSTWLSHITSGLRLAHEKH
jgi:phenylalanine-4-hydroxylase